MSEVKSKYATLLNALDEMQQSIAYAARRSVLGEAERTIVDLERQLASLAPAWSQEAPKVPGWYWWRWIALGHGPSVRHVTTAEMTQNGWQHGEWAGPLIVPPEGTR